MNWTPAPLSPPPRDRRAARDAIRRPIAMRQLPIFLEVSGKAAVVVGGGVVGGATENRNTSSGPAPA